MSTSAMVGKFRWGRVQGLCPKEMTCGLVQAPTHGVFLIFTKLEASKGKNTWKNLQWTQPVSNPRYLTQKSSVSPLNHQNHSFQKANNMIGV
jgi:hypothetical protein